jgi:hypothetical protein
MTAMTTAEIMDCIKQGGRELNRQLALGLDEQRLIRTGGYRNQSTATAHNHRPPLDPDAVKRNENDVSFNYSQVLFDLGRGTSTASTAAPAPRKLNVVR